MSARKLLVTALTLLVSGDCCALPLSVQAEQLSGSLDLSRQDPPNRETAPLAKDQGEEQAHPAPSRPPSESSPLSDGKQEHHGQPLTGHVAEDGELFCKPLSGFVEQVAPLNRSLSLLPPPKPVGAQVIEPVFSARAPVVAPLSPVDEPPSTQVSDPFYFSSGPVSVPPVFYAAGSGSSWSSSSSFGSGSSSTDFTSLSGGGSGSSLSSSAGCWRAAGGLSGITAMGAFGLRSCLPSFHLPSICVPSLHLPCLKLGPFAGFAVGGLGSLSGFWRSFHKTRSASRHKKVGSGAVSNYKQDFRIHEQSASSSGSGSASGFVPGYRGAGTVAEAIPTQATSGEADLWANDKVEVQVDTAQASARAGALVSWDDWYRCFLQSLYDAFGKEGQYPGVARVRIVVSSGRTVKAEIVCFLPPSETLRGGTDEFKFRQAVFAAIYSLNGARLLDFPEGSKRSQVSFDLAMKAAVGGPVGFTGWQRHEVEATPEQASLPAR